MTHDSVPELAFALTPKEEAERLLTHSRDYCESYRVFRHEQTTKHHWVSPSCRRKRCVDEGVYNSGKLSVNMDRLINAASKITIAHILQYCQLPDFY